MGKRTIVIEGVGNNTREAAFDAARKFKDLGMRQEDWVWVKQVRDHLSPSVLVRYSYEADAEVLLPGEDDWRRWD